MNGYIAIEGPIGAGKTTLARKLAQDLGAYLLLERPEDNPFLARFYQDPLAAALPAQLTFLLQRAGQAEQLHQRDLFSHGCVADFLFDKDRLFAGLTLSQGDYDLYMRVYERLAWHVPPPDRVIYLSAPVDTLWMRVVQRGRSYESSISTDYLARLSEAYGRFFCGYPAAPVIEVDTSRFDFMHNDGHYRELLAALRATATRVQLPRSGLL